MARCFVGVDGGSSETTGIVLDEAKGLVARAVGGPTNYHAADLERAEAHLFELIGRLLEKAGTTAGHVTHFCFALSGVSREADRRAIGGVLDRHGILERSALVSDVEAVMATVDDDGPVIVVIAGTGSVVLGRDEQGRLCKVGGNGHLLDDGGSGYDIGVSGLRAVLEASDGRGPTTQLAETLLAAAGLGAVNEIVPWFYGSSDRKRYVAGLAPRVIETATNGDGPATAILQRAAEELAQWVRVAAAALSATDRGVRIVLAGGVLEHSDLYHRLVKERIEDELPHTRVVRPDHEAAYGAALLAMAR